MGLRTRWPRNENTSLQLCHACRLSSSRQTPRHVSVSTILISFGTCDLWDYCNLATARVIGLSEDRETSAEQFHCPSLSPCVTSREGDRLMYILEQNPEYVRRFHPR